MRNIELTVFFLLCFVFAPSLQAQNSVGVKIVGTGLIRESQLWIHSRATVYVIGDRMLNAGHERTVFAGTISRGSSPGTAGKPFSVYTEISGKVRIEDSESGSKHIVGSDGGPPWSDQGAATQDDEAFVQTFLNDTVEHFFELQSSGAAMRFYGANFRFDNGTTPNYAGPFYDVYELADTAVESGESTHQPKVFCINSKTKLLERVQYKPSHQGSSVKIETVLSGWQTFSGQKFPTSVARFEDGQQVWQVDMTPVSIGPAATDGIFSHP